MRKTQREKHLEVVLRIVDAERILGEPQGDAQPPAGADAGGGDGEGGESDKTSYIDKIAQRALLDKIYKQARAGQGVGGSNDDVDGEEAEEEAREGDYSREELLMMCRHVPGAFVPHSDAQQRKLSDKTLKERIVSASQARNIEEACLGVGGERIGTVGVRPCRVRQP